MAVLSATTQRAEVLRYTRIYVPLGTLVTAWEFLQTSGMRACEQICFFAGRVVIGDDGPAAQVTSCVLPVTVASADHVRLTSHAQTAAILDALETRGEVPLMTMHTHPDGGVNGCGPEHSTVDDRGVALSPDDGLFSVVVAHYALGSPFGFPRRSTVYERVAGAWRRLPSDERDQRILVRDDTLRLVVAGEP